MRAAMLCEKRWVREYTQHIGHICASANAARTYIGAGSSAAVSVMRATDGDTIHDERNGSMAGE